MLAAPDLEDDIATVGRQDETKAKVDDAPGAQVATCFRSRQEFSNEHFLQK